MALKPIQSKSLEVFFRTGVFSTNWHRMLSFNQDGPARNIIYYDRLDAMIALGQRFVSAGVYQGVMLQWDPRGVDNTAPLSRAVDTGVNVPSRMAVGEWDRVNNTQALYTGADLPDEIWPMDPVSLAFVDAGASVFPFNWKSNGGGLTAVGDWSTDNSNGDLCIFDVWGYTIASAQVKHTDGVVYTGLAQISHADGKAVLLDGVPTLFTTSPKALFESTPFFGDSFGLRSIQFVPDDDSRAGIPKGRLFLASQTYLGDGNVANSNNRQYLKIVEFNPLGIAASPGSPNREHLRELLFTRLDYIQRQAFGTNPNSLGDFLDGGSPSFNADLRMFFHPPTRTMLQFNDTSVADFENEHGFVQHALTPVLAVLEAPTQLSEVETNKTVTFRTRAAGAQGDAIGGLTADWSLERRSTIDEVLNTSGAPTSNVVANPPIDANTLVVKFNGTPLTLGVDYTVVESTGTITWAGSHAPPAASGYTASYTHSNTGAQPPHGTLLQATTLTDETGTTETRVKYPDDATLENGRDRISVQVSD